LKDLSHDDGVFPDGKLWTSFVGS